MQTQYTIYNTRKTRKIVIDLLEKRLKKLKTEDLRLFTSITTNIFRRDRIRTTTSFDMNENLGSIETKSLKQYINN